jgi:phage terminase large subunit-like protein
MLPTSLREQKLRELAEELGKPYNEAFLAWLKYWWPFWARPQQQAPPGDWDVWFVSSGRGYGKTRAGAEWIKARVAQGYGRIVLVADDAGDARDVMVEGESGILSLYPKDQRPRYVASQAKVEWPNGATAHMYSASDPDSLRGPQGDTAWCDEIAKWTYQERAWDNLMMGMRLGTDPRTVVTGTPTNSPVVRMLFGKSERPTALRVVKTGGPTHDNLHNLAGPFARTIEQYEGTRLGRQELYAELLLDVEGALWTYDLIERHRIGLTELPELVRIVVAVDPAITAEEDSNETGIVVVGADARDHGYVLEDRSGVYTPIEWAREVNAAYVAWGADCVVAEGNQGGAMVEQTIRSSGYRGRVRTVFASRGKFTRAEPVAAKYERGEVHHVGLLPKLEDQMTGWTPGRVSPDRMDAMVHGASFLFVTGKSRKLVTG